MKNTGERSTTSKTSWSTKKLNERFPIAVIAFVMAGKGVNDLKLSSLAPSRTAQNVKRDANAVKDAYDDK